MRRTLIAGNWKMNLRSDSAVELARQVVRGREGIDADLVVCPPHVYLQEVIGEVGDAGVGVGAQNASSFEDGAYTGEVSCGMLVELGCSHVILGHSERRQVLGETDDTINAKLHVALAHGLIPIVCLGEQLSERESGRTFAVLETQFEGAFRGVSADQMSGLVIAYEPVWAIGTGRVASTEQAQEVHADLRKRIQKQYNSQVAELVRILYGGSVKPDNARRLLEQPDIDGALVGGASLDSEAFLAIARAADRR